MYLTALGLCAIMMPFQIACEVLRLSKDGPGKLLGRQGPGLAFPGQLGDS